MREINDLIVVEMISFGSSTVEMVERSFIRMVKTIWTLITGLFLVAIA
jgi:hypothetical protein